MSIGNMMKITGAWNTFKNNHPKFPAFCQAVSDKPQSKRERSGPAETVVGINSPCLSAAIDFTKILSVYSCILRINLL